VELGLPRFDVDARADLVEALRALGVTRAFDPVVSGFPHMTSAEDPVFISRVVHQAVVRVAEEGTEAAAATAVIMDRCASAAPREVERITVDRPFLFLIRDRVSNALLFMGRVVRPS
jgi:serpin B